MAEKIFGIDVSRYQGVCKWPIIAAKGVKFAGIRTSISWAYVDPQAQANIDGALANGIDILPYWVLYPNEDAKKQVDHFYGLLQKWGVKLNETYCVIDVEMYAGFHKCTPAKYQSTLSNALVYSKTISGKAPVIYSRASFINYYVTGIGQIFNPKIPSWYDTHYWWLAHYLSSGLEHPGPVAIPKGVDRGRVIIHQTTDKGTPFGVESAALDYNRWQLGDAAYDDFFGASNGVPVPGSQRTNPHILNLRDSPDSTGNIIGTITPNSKFQISGTVGKWAKINGWLNTEETDPVNE